MARARRSALVGESGSGKSTIARLVLRLLEPTAGAIRFDGDDIAHLSRRALRRSAAGCRSCSRTRTSSLDPRMTARAIVAEPLRIAAKRREIAQRVPELFDARRARPRARWRATRTSSRAGNASASASPARWRSSRSSLVLDEPVSALDVSIQAQILNLLAELQARLGLAYLFIAHDLAVVRHIADRVAVMHLGKIVETAPTAELFDAPAHPYTQALLSAVARARPDVRTRTAAHRARRRAARARDDPPSGCRFRTRCWKAADECAAPPGPELVDRGQGHPVACLFPESTPSI